MFSDLSDTRSQLIFGYYIVVNNNGEKIIVNSRNIYFCLMLAAILKMAAKFKMAAIFANS